jgi:glycine oxidase|tara:strand:+ start:1318 stop:2328 length:1011 start_codon:yes stop_codon:yes gene_type:complete
LNVKIVVIGAGVVGCLTAIKLKEEGFDVTIVDKSQLGSESTWAGAGILFPLMPWEYESRVFDLCKNASKFYKDFSKKLFQYTNIDSEYIESGLICTPPFDKKNILEWASKNNIKASEYKYNEKSSYLFQSVGQIRAPRLMKSIKLYMKDIGINLLEETQLEHINNNNIKIKEWPTVGGDKIHADIFVLTSGAWTFELKKHYKEMIYPVRGQMIQYQKTKVILKHILYSDDFYVLQRKDGVILAGSTVEHVGFDKSVSKIFLSQLMKKAVKLVPELKDIEPQKHWAGIRPGTKKNIPIIQKDKYHDNVFINSGHFRYGLTMAPKSAEEVCSMIIKSI